MAKENNKTARLPLPPAILMAIFLIVALLFGWKLPIPVPFPVWMKLVGWAISLGGIGIGFSAVRTMEKAHTSPDPDKPTSEIVKQGPYRLSRNPIYLSYVMFVIGLPLAIGYYWGAILAPIVVDAYDRLIIAREETYLEHIFGQKYLEYKSSVRRWL
ncbi:MAG: isoprenylcysteine carboxylmethyltransferase family protein [Chloroflexi bacterium]|nr:isoprenylcysteine carboxylmethyltransferase family protein [Chloroflexota bacterium]